MDRSTSRAVCEGVGERLRQFFQADTTDTPEHLRMLVEEMRRREH